MKLSEKYRTALVTGGTSGLGLAFCEALVSEGVSTFSVSRNPDKLPKLSGLHGMELDLSDLSSVSAFALQFIENHGVPDLLINNAGYGACFEWELFPEEEISSQVDVMLKAPSLLCLAFAPAMSKKGFGAIVNVSSLAVQYPLPFLPMYNASKAGLSAFSSSLAIEYQGRAPLIIDFRPGDFCTSFNEVANCSENEASDRASMALRVMKDRLQKAPDPSQAARKLFSALREGRSGVVYAGNFLQSRVGPIFQRLLPVTWLHRFVHWYYNLRKER